MAVKEYSAFLKAPALLEPHQLLCLVLYPGHSFGESYPSEEIQSEYSVVPSDWTKKKTKNKHGRLRQGLDYFFLILYCITV